MLFNQKFLPFKHHCNWNNYCVILCYQRNSHVVTILLRTDMDIKRNLTDSRRHTTSNRNSSYFIVFRVFASLSVTYFPCRFQQPIQFQHAGRRSRRSRSQPGLWHQPHSVPQSSGLRQGGQQHELPVQIDCNPPSVNHWSPCISVSSLLQRK